MWTNERDPAKRRERPSSEATDHEDIYAFPPLPPISPRPGFSVLPGAIDIKISGALVYAWGCFNFFIVLRCLAFSHQIKTHMLMHGPK